MNGNWLNTAYTSTQSVTLTDTNGGTHADTEQLAGDVLETATYTNDVSPLVIDHATISSYWVSGATGGLAASCAGHGICGASSAADRRTRPVWWSPGRRRP